MIIQHIGIVVLLAAPPSDEPDTIVENSRSDVAFAHFKERITENANTQTFLQEQTERKKWHFIFDVIYANSHLRRFNRLDTGDAKWISPRYSQLGALMYNGDGDGFSGGAFYTISGWGLTRKAEGDIGLSPDLGLPRPRFNFMAVAAVHASFRNYASARIGYAYFSEKLSAYEGEDSKEYESEYHGLVYSLESPLLSSYAAITQAIESKDIRNAAAAVREFVRTAQRLRGSQPTSPVDVAAGYTWSFMADLHSQNADLAYLREFDGPTNTRLAVAVTESAAVNRPRLNYLGAKLSLTSSMDSTQAFNLHMQWGNSEIYEYFGQPNKAGRFGVKADVSMHFKLMRAGLAFAYNDFDMVAASPTLVDAPTFYFFIGAGR